MSSTRLELSVQHETRYDYAAPVSLAHHLLHLRPLVDVHQDLLQFDLNVTPRPNQLQDGGDVFGNACSHFTISQPHEYLLVRSSSRVRVAPRFALMDAARSPAWETVRDRLRYVARQGFDGAVEFVQPSPYVPRLAALREFIAPSFPAAAPIALAAIELMHRVYSGFTYRSRSTDIDTPLEQAFLQRTGVCQDFAHVMLGCLRMLGLPARYVSGYLLTHSSDDGHAMAGADASHAWVQVWVPDTPGVPANGWLDLDPTNDVIPGTDHVRVAVGRDYGDVVPLRGVIRGGGKHTLAVAVTTRVVSPAQSLQA